MDIERYLADIDEVGMKEVWNRILNPTTGLMDVDEIQIGDFSELYEIGLAHSNKWAKKRGGQYFTPQDVAGLMAEELEVLNGENVADVCCGVGNLILAYLSRLGVERVRRLILSGKLWLYDIDPLAMEICTHSIGTIYGMDVLSSIHQEIGDFLDRTVHLPSDCKVITNPPYSAIKSIPSSWERTEVVLESRELFACMVEKVAMESRAAVMITPQTFLGGEKFLNLRKVLSKKAGWTVVFDNVPGNIFNGTKHGDFGASNARNHVRAAITVLDDFSQKPGIRCSGMIRFHHTDRERLLKMNSISALVGQVPQVVDDSHPRFAKCFPSLEGILNQWQRKAGSETLGQHLCDGEFQICFPDTCRYATVGTLRDLNRSGKRILGFRTEEERDLAYCWVNSSFCYWHWRLYDGNIVYQLGLLKSLPVIMDSLDPNVKEKMIDQAKRMQEMEGQCLKYKGMRGVKQENVKFPNEERVRLNELILEAMDCPRDPSAFDIVHSASVYGGFKGKF